MISNSPYGVTFGAQGNLQPVPDRIATMVKMGIGNMRLFANWDAIEIKDPNTGEIKFDFTILDGVIKLANQAGIAVTYCLDSAPAWHQDNTLCSGKAFMIPEDAASFLAMIAHRYTPGDPANPGGLFIVGVEGANEGFSDGAQHCQIGPYAANHMKVVYPAVKAVNPNLVVGSPAIIGLQLSYITDWMEAYYSNGGGDFSDYDHFHFYTQLSPIDTPDPGHASFAMYYQAMAAVQEKYGYSKKPIRCTEIGYAVPGKSGSFTYQQQSDNYLATLDSARQSQGKVEMVELFTIGGSDGFSPVEHLGANEVEHELVAAHASYVKQYPTWDTQGKEGNSVTILSNFPMVSQRSTVTSDGKPSENALYDCVPASIGAVMLWLEDKSAWDSTINPDKLKDAAYGDAYTGGTSASKYIAICKSMGFTLSSVDTSSPAQTVAIARQMLSQNKPVIFTELDPYVDTHLPAYAGWTHVCVWIGDDTSGLTAMDPFIAQPVYKSDATWESLLRANQVWSLEKIPMSTVPANWHDDGHTLIAPNSVPVVLGFRNYVLSHNWESDNYPLGPQYYTKLLEDSNPNLGDGDQILFRRTMLGYPHNPQGSAASLKDTVIEEFVGSELVTARALASKYYAAIQTLTAQLTSAQQQIQQLQSQQQGNPQEHALLLQVKQSLTPISQSLASIS